VVDVVMAVMKEDALPVKVEHIDAATDNVFDLLTVVTGLETALMAVMRLDVLVLLASFAVTTVSVFLPLFGAME